jgi:hypothetical protein
MGSDAIDNDGPPPWDDTLGSVLIGKTVLIGLTYLDPEGERLEQKHGTIVAVDGHNGVEIRLEGAETGSLFYLPPHLDAFHPASPGEYRLAATGDVVVDPDCVTTWVINLPDD